MKLDVTQKIMGLDENPTLNVMLCDKCLAEGKQTIIDRIEVTLRQILCNSLVSPHQTDGPDMPGKLARFNLALEIQRDDVFECDKARLEELKKRVDLMNPSALIVGRVCELLDAAAEEKDDGGKQAG